MKYICEHSIPDNTIEERIFTLSANDKADYIVSVFNACNVDIEMISCSRTAAKKGAFRKRCDLLHKGFCVISAPTFATRGKLMNICHKIYSLLWLSFYLIKTCTKGECIVVYHSVFTIIPVLLAKKIKKVKIINEVEEVFFAMNSDTSRWRILLEKEMFAKSDAYIFASRQLNSRINVTNPSKRFVIANGSYITYPVCESRSIRRCQIVYAGLIENEKAAFTCVEIAKYLTDEYQLKIIGYGKEKDINSLRKKIEQNNLKNACKIVFDGTLRGEEYIRYLQKCHIGICPLSENKQVQLGCFPSKITSYISNGLCVVTTQNEVIKESEYGENIVFTESNTPSVIARKIMSIDWKNLRDARNIMITLDEQLKKEIRAMVVDFEIE